MIYRFTATTIAMGMLATGCSGAGDDPADTTATATSTVPAATASAPSTDASPTSQTSADIDVDSSGDTTADAQDAEGTASLGTAAATLEVDLPGEWQYEGTYGDGAAPYAVLVDASQPFDLSEPGSEAYLDSVWVQVETYRVSEPWPHADAVAEDAPGLAEQLSDSTGGEAVVVDGKGVPMVHAAYEQDGSEVEDLYALHGDLWVLARPSNVDVAGYIDGGDVPILVNILEESRVK